MNDLDALVRTRRLIVCVGSGGVGKTTTAASIALRAALLGRRALVLTIDPARRLANALGLNEIGNTEVRIDLGSLAAYGPDGVSTERRPGGELWAMMLDPRSTLDDVIARVARDAPTREAIYGNRIYRHIAGSFSGSQEYMATERLYDVHASGRYDLIVLDTPPVKNALDFLESPGRLTRFLDKQIMQWFLAPQQGERAFGKRLLVGTSTIVYRLLGHIFGRDFLDELSSFFKLFGELYDGFRERHDAVSHLFTGRDTAFVVVSAPTEASADVATFFLDELRTRRLPLAGLVVNQVHVTRADTPDVETLLGTAAKSINIKVAPMLMARLGMAHRRLRSLSLLEQSRIDSLRRSLPSGAFLRTVPRLRHEVHDLQALAALHTSLFDVSETRV